MRHRDSDYGAQAAGLLLALCYLIGNPPRTPGNGSAHPPLRTSTHPPTRGVVREWVSYEADPGEDYRQGCRAMIVLSGCTVCRVGSGVHPASEPCHELPGAGDGVCG